MRAPPDMRAYDVHKPRFSISGLRLASSAQNGSIELHGEPHPGLYESLVSMGGATRRDRLLNMGR